MVSTVTAVVLAAGEGTRLRPYTLDRPKCLVDVGGRALLGIILDALEAAGVRDAVVVTGYRAHDVDRFLAARPGKLVARTVENPRYAETNNAYSLWCARDAVPGGMLLLDGDLVFEPRVARVLTGNLAPVVLAVQKRGNLGVEEMKVVLDQNGDILRISKEIPPGDAAGESIGMARFLPEATRALFERLDAQVAAGVHHVWYESAFQEMIDGGWEFTVGDVSALSCMEIDTPDDLAAAKTLVARVA